MSTIPCEDLSNKCRDIWLYLLSLKATSDWPHHCIGVAFVLTLSRDLLFWFIGSKALLRAIYLIAGLLPLASCRLQPAFFDYIYKLSMIEGCLGSIRRRDALRWQDEACVLVFDFYRCEGFWRGIARDIRSRAKFVCFIGMFLWVCAGSLSARRCLFTAMMPSI